MADKIAGTINKIQNATAAAPGSWQDWSNPSFLQNLWYLTPWGEKSYQEWFASTQYQRMVEDMQKAQLNPLLYGAGGAKPAGEVPKVSGTQKVLEAAQIAQSWANISLTKAQARKANQEANHLRVFNPLLQQEKQIQNEIAAWTKEDQEAIIKLTRYIKENEQFMSAVKKNIADKYGMDEANIKYNMLGIQQDIMANTGMEKAEAEIAAMLIMAAINEQSAKFWGGAGLPPNFKPSGAMGIISTIYAYLENVRRNAK